MKPQTYNNFIGSQGSKPSVELILGAVNRFGANPNWVLNGKGSVFQEWTPEQESRLRTGGEMDAWAAQLSDPETRQQAGLPVGESLQTRLKTMDEKLADVERRLDSLEGTKFPLVKEIRSLLWRLFDTDPVQAEKTAQDLVERLQKIVDSPG